MPEGRHFLQIPGPSNVPAIDHPTIDHRGPDFAQLATECLDGMRLLFKTKNPVVIYSSSGTGAWEAALVNVLNPGDRVVAFESGHFAAAWAKVARNLCLNVELIQGDWRRAADPASLAEILSKDGRHDIKAVMAVHNETSTGVVSDIAAIRGAIDSAGHPALLMADTVSSLGSMDYRHDEWGADVTVSGSQKGLMLPPGLAFNAISDKALAASKSSRSPKSYWRWDDMLEMNAKGFFPYTPSSNLLYGLRESIKMLTEEGLDQVFRRHQRHAEATRRAVRAWELELFAANASECSSTVTAVLMPGGFPEADFRALILKKFNMSLGAGLSKLAGKVFRIGHLGHFNDLMLAGTLSGVEMGLALAGVPHRSGGVQAALAYLTEEAKVR
jgi:alanine-glyoxylate transaminase/serine-glyoxylate transaminase/serine-pyruvate transaminase